MSSFIPRNLTEMKAITGCTFACICNTVFCMFSCLQINCQPFYLRQLLKFHQFDWLIEIYLQIQGQGTHHKMVSLQPMSDFSPLLISDKCYLTTNKKPEELESEFYHFDADSSYPTSHFKGHNIVDLDFVYKQLLDGHKACKTTLFLTQYQIERLIGLTRVLHFSLQNCSTVTMVKTSIYDVKY